MSQGQYPRYILLQADSPGSKRTLFESGELEEVAEFAVEKTGRDVDEIPEEWFWHDP